jgi:hypothetical protein
VEAVHGAIYVHNQLRQRIATGPRDRFLMMESYKKRVIGAAWNGQDQMSYIHRMLFDLSQTDNVEDIDKN